MLSAARPMQLAACWEPLYLQVSSCRRRICAGLTCFPPQPPETRHTLSQGLTVLLYPPTLAPRTCTHACQCWGEWAPGTRDQDSQR